MPQMPDMVYRQLGRTGLQVSLASLGAGGASRLGQNTHRDPSESRHLVRRALELGINLFDTAPSYGSSEEILGDALDGVSRERFIIATKFTWARNGVVISPEALVESCDESLRRLQVDTIDLYQVHGLLLTKYDQVVEQLYPTLESLKRQGKIRHIGMTERPDSGASRAISPRRSPEDPYADGDLRHDVCIRAAQDDLWDAMMVKYGMLNFTAEDALFPAVKEKNIGVLNMAAVRNKLRQPEELEALIVDAKARGRVGPDVPSRGPLDFLLHDHVDSIISAGYKFGVMPPEVSTLLIGTGSVEHLEANVAAILGPSLPDDDYRRVHEILAKVAVTG